MKLPEVDSQFRVDLKKTKSLSELERLQIKYLGRKGLINHLFQSVSLPAQAGKLSSEEKKEFGKKINLLKTSINQFIEVRRHELLKAADTSSFFDITIP